MAEETSGNQDTRRGFFEIAAIVLGAIISLGPVLIGLFFFLDPLGRKKAAPLAYRDSRPGAKEGYYRVAPITALAEGTPQRFPVIADQRDAWNFMPDQPIGAVYVELVKAPDQIRVFNATCPHAGCSVSCTGTAYLCPCHNSAFNLDGTKRQSESGRENPSPRSLDDLAFEVRDQEIWVEFKNFYTGKHEKIAKS